MRVLWMLRLQHSTCDAACGCCCLYTGGRSAPARCPALQRSQPPEGPLHVAARVNTALRECRGRCIVSACLPSCTTRTWQQHDVSTLGSWAGFARWLPKHAGLVSSLTMHQEKPVLGLTEADMACEQLLHSALQLSAMSQPAPAEREEGEFVTPPPPPLRLHEFRSLFPVDLLVLNALAAAQVQVAQLRVQPRMVLPFFCHAVGSLTSLQELCIKTDTQADEAEALPAAVLTAARQLQGLQRLELCSMRPEDAPRLRPNLQELDVTWAPCGADTLADLSHLSPLRECTWRAVKKFRRMQALLPAQLTHAKLHSPIAVVAPGLSVQSAMVAVSCDEGLEVLQDLTSLAKLRALGACVLPDGGPDAGSPDRCTAGHQAAHQPDGAVPVHNRGP